MSSPDYLFRGSILEFWRLVYAEWSRYQQDSSYSHNPLHLSHLNAERPPLEYEEVVLEFLDDYFRRPLEPEPKPIAGMTWPQGPTFVFPLEPVRIPVTVRARMLPNRESVGLAVAIHKVVCQKDGQAALVRWNKLLTSWQKADLVIDLFASITSPSKPELAQPFPGQISAHTAVGLSSMPDKKAKMQLKTEFALKKLREDRLTALNAGRLIPKKALAMEQAKITEKTWRKHDPELWARWDDPVYMG